MNYHYPKGAVNVFLKRNLYLVLTFIKTDTLDMDRSPKLNLLEFSIGCPNSHACNCMGQCMRLHYNFYL